MTGLDADGGAAGVMGRMVGEKGGFAVRQLYQPMGIGVRSIEKTVVVPLHLFIDMATIAGTKNGISFFRMSS